MQIQVEALVTRFKGEIKEVQPIRDMYTEVSVIFRPSEEIFQYMKKNRKDFSGDSWVKEKYFLPCMEKNETFNISGEAKDVQIWVGDELSVSIEKMTVDWKKDV